MGKSNFEFLEEEFEILYNLGQAAEFNLYQDTDTSLYKLRKFGERISIILFEEHFLKFPYDNTFHNRLMLLNSEKLLPDTIKDILFNIKNKGNATVHDNRAIIDEAKIVIETTFKLAKWFYETYAVARTDVSYLKFAMPKETDISYNDTTLEKKYKELEDKLESVIKDRLIKVQSKEDRQDILERSNKAASKIEMNENETRVLIDEQLRKVGWDVDSINLNYRTRKTLPQKGKNMAIAEWPAGRKRADYALFIGTTLYGIVEAKRYSQDISTDLRQAKVYSELVTDAHDITLLSKWREYNVPFLFSTNGRPYLEQIKTKSGVWHIDIRKANNQAKVLKGWYSPEGLEKIYKQNIKSANNKLLKDENDYLQSASGLGLRKYQLDAIEAVENLIINNPLQNRALLAMATGTGKTRTIMGLCHRLIKSNRFRRILFMVDRTLLGTQAMDAFTDNKIVGLSTFADVYEVKGLEEATPDIDTRLHFATVQGMVHRLLYAKENKEIPAVDAYDCIIVDEAHRGYLNDREINEDDLDFKNQKDYVSKYRTVLDYFDAFAVGLTATPALHTTDIFGKPIYTYSYREAVIDGYLVDHEPPVQIKTKLSEEGIKWEKGEKPKAYDRETNSIIELAELKDEIKIEIEGFNKLVLTESFNRTVIKYLVKEIDPEDDGKTLVFAATDEHADEVVRIFKEEYAEIGYEIPDKAIQKITGKSYNPAEQVKLYKNEKWPNIAVTVDLLTTGIDVPKISNLVFLRRIKSRILYEQMLGRATRLCDEIGKEVFMIYDAVRLYEALEDYTQMKPVLPSTKTTFTQLAEELADIDNNERSRKQLDQIIAKLQRKKKYIKDDIKDKFKYHSLEQDPDSFIDMLKSDKAIEDIDSIMKMTGLWNMLDELKPASAILLISEKEDEYIRVDRGYGEGQKPEDYLESFAEFIEENKNKISALNVVCNKPNELDRKSLKELKLLLDENGYSDKKLNVAWRQYKNEDIAADIISYIRTLSIGNVLISHDERIKRAVKKVREMREWTKIQLNWIERFEKQLLQESVLRAEDLDKDPFAERGGYKRLNKIFEYQLEEVISIINDNLYIEIA